MGGRAAVHQVCVCWIMRGLMSALRYVLAEFDCKLTPFCCASISRAWAECPWMRSLKPPCMCMSRRFIVPISSSASMTSGSRTSCAMWLSWWRARSSAGTGLCWPPAASISYRRWWARWRMAWSLAFRKRYICHTRCFHDTFLSQEWNWGRLWDNATPPLSQHKKKHILPVSFVSQPHTLQHTEPWPWTTFQPFTVCVTKST